ncbi:aminoglycoside phosphotransferase family protein [Kribbella sp. NPDC048915]|uniref:phosphotransferase family protein n=1 Tax=Kribbella sp. NPDC048915 TaxID=3155148 RepID=UPI0033F2B873
MDAAGSVREVLGLQVDEVVERTGGQLSSVYEVRTSADPVIVKVYAPDWRWKQAKEVHVYAMLQPVVGDSIPRVLHVSDGVTMLSKIDGVPLSQAEPPDWRALYAQLGALVRKVHQIAQPAYGYLIDRILEPLPDNDQYMRWQFTKKLREYDELGGAPALHREIARHVDRHAHLFADNPAAVLCHNDFHEGNILVDPDTWRVNGFIDVENAIAADPLIDLAKTIQYSVRDNREKRAGLLDGYGAVPEDRIDLYRLYHSLELWDWFASIGETTHLDSIAQDLAKLVER